MTADDDTLSRNMGGHRPPVNLARSAFNLLGSCRLAFAILHPWAARKTVSTAHVSAFGVENVGFSHTRSAECS